MTMRINLKKGLFILAIYSIMTLCLFMATDHLKRLENNYNSSDTYVNIDK